MTEAFSVRAWADTMARVLGRLADPADLQLAYLSQLGVEGSIDELALEFDDVFRPLAPALSERGASDVVAALGAVDAALGSETLGWSAAALLESPEWNRIRALAGTAKGSLNQSVHDMPQNPQSR